MAEAGTPPQCEAQQAPSDLLAALQTRESRVVSREAQIEDRLQALRLAESEIDEKLAALTEAEQSLAVMLDLASSAAEDDLGRLTLVYENMPPEEVAALFEEMAPEFSSGFLARMEPTAAAGGHVEPDANDSLFDQRRHRRPARRRPDQLTALHQVADQRILSDARSGGMIQERQGRTGHDRPDRHHHHLCHGFRRLPPRRWQDGNHHEVAAVRDDHHRRCGPWRLCDLERHRGDQAYDQGRRPVCSKGPNGSQPIIAICCACCIRTDPGRPDQSGRHRGTYRVAGNVASLRSVSADRRRQGGCRTDLRYAALGLDEL